MKKLKILITSGGTSEPIDSVRVITNKSTGRTGAIIADHFIEQGAEVVYLGSKRGIKPTNQCQILEFTTFKSLYNSLEKELTENDFDLVIHSAAVSDFSVIPVEGKISSDSPPELKFTKNPKIVDSLKSWSRNKQVRIVAFKLTANATIKERQLAVSKLINRSKADLVVFNDISEIGANGHLSEIKDSSGATIETCKTKEELAQKLWKVI